MSLCELGCPNLDYVYDMTWAEYMIRLFGYQRQKKEELFLTRELAWAMTIGSHLDPKKLPKSKEEFWRLEDKEVDTSRFDKLRAEQQKYKQRNGR